MQPFNPFFLNQAFSGRNCFPGEKEITDYGSKQDANYVKQYEKCNPAARRCRLRSGEAKSRFQSRF